MSNIFDDISNGSIDLSEVVTEAAFPESIPYGKTIIKQIYLPQGSPIGRGNLCFLYSHTLQDSIGMMKNEINFLNRKHYKYYYYNVFYQGKLYNKRYRFRELEERKGYYKTVEDSSTIVPRMKLVGTRNDNRNMYYDLFRYLEIFTNICGKLQPIRYANLYWEYMKQIFSVDIPGYTKRFVLVDLEKFPISKSVKDSLTNPLYMIYYTALRTPAVLSDVNIDFYFYSKKRVLKLNPSQLPDKSYVSIRVEMNKMMQGIVPDDTLKKITDDTSIQKEEIAEDSVAQVTKVFNTNDETVITTNEELVKLNKVSAVEKEVKDKVKEKTDKVEKIAGDNPVDVKTVTKNIASTVQKEIDDDKKIVEKIYHQTVVDQRRSDASTARDNMLREEQKNIQVGNMTIAEIEKINASNIPIPVHDVSKVVTTTNDNMKQLQFMNLDKTYTEKLMKKDITDAILALNNKSIPMFIRDIKIEDTSDELNYKETYTILLEDANRKRHTVKVDIPKFIDDRFLYIGGNKKIIKHQSFFMPVVKISHNMVQIVTNYSKMTIERVENKSLSSIERLKKLVTANADVRSHFSIGGVYANNAKFLTTLEYDDLSKVYSNFRNGTSTFLMFDQSVVADYMAKHNIPNKDKKMYIGKNKGIDCFIDVNTQEDENGNSIVDIIMENLPEALKEEFTNTKAPKRLMYTKVRIMSQFVEVGMLLGFWEGLSSLLKRLKVDYRLEDKIPKNLASNEEFLKFSDCIMVYKQDIPTALIMNGFKMFNTQNYRMVDFDDKEPYLDYVKKKYGKVIIENALMNFYEFAVDNITLEIAKTMNLPTDIIGLFIYAVNLLSDSQYIPDINQNFSRIRSNEIIPAILYERLAKNYVVYRNFNGRKKFSVPQDCVIKEVLALKTVEDYSTLNPTLEMEQIHGLSAKGFRGVNLDKAYTIPKRSFDPSMEGVVAPSTSPDGQVGVSKTLVMEPKILNLRGFTEDNSKSLDKLKDVNLFSAGELSIPLGAANDDPNRLGHALKQSKHVIPVKKSSPVLISNGLEEVARFNVTSNFAVNADEDGEIIDYDEKANIMIAKYKSGKCKAIDLSPTIVKNGGGGFYLSNILTTSLKVGDKFKKDSVLAYHKDFFKNDRFNNCRMNMGTLTKVAIMSTYNTYEDATMITHKMSQDCATEMCFCKSAVVGKNSNVFYMVKKGQEITVGDPLISFDTSFEDDSINALLANLAKEDKENILEEARNEIKSKYSGVIEDIKIYPVVDLDEMSPSLRKIVNGYYKEINQKKEFLEKYDPESKKSIVKCGVLVNDATHKIEPNRFGVIKGEHVEDGVLIEFYIKHSEPLEIGSKIANFTALKNTIGEIIPEGYEPYSHYRPDEEVGTLIASNSILNRMTPSILLTALGNKCIIELKRHLQEIYPDRKKMETMIYKFFTAFDKSGVNTKKYKALFQPMSDAQFKNYFKEFFENEDAYLILEIVDYEHIIGLEDIERAADVLKVPLFEYVTLPHLTMDKGKCITTKEKVPVGYINEKRTQQTVMKKNGISTETSQRSAITGQVTGKDKNGRESDLENTMLTALGMPNTLKELNAPRADDAVMEQQMLHDIALNGYTRLADMTDDVMNKTALNTVDCYFRGMSIESDLVVKGLMLPSTLKEEL